MREGWQLRETRWVGLRSGVWDASGDRRHSIKISDEILLSVVPFAFGVVRQTQPRRNPHRPSKSYRILSLVAVSLPGTSSAPASCESIFPQSFQNPYFSKIYILLFPPKCTRIKLQVEESGRKWMKMVCRWRHIMTGDAYVHG